MEVSINCQYEQSRRASHHACSGEFDCNSNNFTYNWHQLIFDIMQWNISKPCIKELMRRYCAAALLESFK